MHCLTKINTYIYQGDVLFLKETRLEDKGRASEWVLLVSSHSNEYRHSLMALLMMLYKSLLQSLRITRKATLMQRTGTRRQSIYHPQVDLQRRLYSLEVPRLSRHRWPCSEHYSYETATTRIRTSSSERLILYPSTSGDRHNAKRTVAWI